MLYIVWTVLLQHDHLSIKLSALVGSHTVLVFPYQTVRQYSIGDFPNRAIECRGYERAQKFWPIPCFISEMIQDRAIVTIPD